MNRRASIFGIVVIVILLMILFRDAKAEFAVFKEHRDIFEAIKNETLNLATERHYTDNTFLFRYGGNATPNRFHDDVDVHLQNKLNQLMDLSKVPLHSLRYSNVEGEHMIDFVFNWERQYGRHTYVFVYCENENLMRSVLNADNSPYELSKLGDAWYGIIYK